MGLGAVNVAADAMMRRASVSILRKTMTSENKNWGECPKCKSPVLIDAATGRAEACAECASRSSASGLYLGGVAGILGLVAFCFVLYVCIKILLG